MSSIRANVDANSAVMTSAMMSAGDPTARAACERVVQSSPKLLSVRGGSD